MLVNEGPVALLDDLHDEGSFPEVDEGHLGDGDNGFGDRENRSGRGGWRAMGMRSWHAVLPGGTAGVLSILSDLSS